MGCAVGKEADEPAAPAANDRHNPLEGPDPVEPHVEVDDGKPALTTDQLEEVWRAGSEAYDEPPHYISRDAGPWCGLEKVPPQPHLVQSVRSSAVGIPPRVVDEADVGPDEAIDLGKDSNGLHVRAFLPHSLTGFCVGWCKPDAATSSLPSDFTYDASTDGARDAEAVRLRRPPKRDVSLRRRLLLFPKAVDAVGVFVSSQGLLGSSFATDAVAGYNEACTSDNVEPMDGAAATFSLVRDAPSTEHYSGRGVASPFAMRSSNEINSPTVQPDVVTVAENSLGFALLPSMASPDDSPTDEADAVTRRLAEELTPVRGQPEDNPPRAATTAMHRAVAGRLLQLPLGRHTLDVTVRFRYATDECTAVLQKPAPTASTTGLRICGSYRPHCTTSSQSFVVSEVVASGQVIVDIDEHARMRLQSVCAD